MKFPFSRGQEGVPTPDPSVSSKRMGAAVEILLILVVSLAIILPVRFFLIQPFYVKGASMEPSFYDHEYLIINQWSYRLHDPVRGEVVVFRPPNDRSQFYIKRVIGLPGETVEIANGTVRVYNDAHPNGVVLEESYVEQGFLGPNQTLTLKAGEYFLMGDNRPASLDSRLFGPVPRKDIVGRVWVRGYPIDRWMYFDHPSYAL